MPKQLADPLQRMVGAATVRFSDQRGQGVRIGGGIILTAAHCLRHDQIDDWCWNEGQPLPDQFAEFAGADGLAFPAKVVAIEIVRDVAALQVERSRAESITPCIARLTREPFDVFIRTPAGGWIAGRAALEGREAANLKLFELAEPLAFGVSGGPVVDECGVLVGIVIQGCPGKRYGRAVRPHLALPAWLVRKCFTDLLC